MTDQAELRALVESAYRTIRDLRAELDARSARARERIAVVGMGCRFPGGDGLDQYWQFLCAAGDGIVPLPPGRWDPAAFFAFLGPDIQAPREVHGGFLGDVDGFDAEFFGIAPAEARAMDPQQRLFLEVAWEAIEHAGLTRDRLRGSETAVYVGVHNQSSDAFVLQTSDPAAITPYTGTGTAHSVMAGRLAHLLDLRGPCMVVDTACSSSLVAVQLAVQALRSGQCERAIVGGVNLRLSPLFNLATAKMGRWPADMRCRTFDSEADGVISGEGCGVIVLERLSTAEAAGDPIYGVVHGAAVNHDGASLGLTAPNSQAQVAVIRQSLADAGVEPHQLGLIEAHGTATKLGDPIETAALVEVLRDRPAEAGACLLGSVKANFGHLEGAAGIAGLIKALLCIAHGQVPPHPHFRRLNPAIDLRGSPLAVTTELRPWPSPGPRFAGVSSFGWSGTNAHVVVGGAPERAAPSSGEPRAWIIPLSAHHRAALALEREAWVAWLNDLEARGAAEPTLADIAMTAAQRRTHLRERIAVVAASRAELSAALTALDLDRSDGNIDRAQAADERGRLWTAARAWARGAELDFRALAPAQARVVALPRRCWSRKSLWVGPRDLPWLRPAGSSLPAVQTVAADLFEIALEPAQFSPPEGPRAWWFLTDGRAGSEGRGRSLADALALALRARGARVTHESVDADTLPALGRRLAACEDPVEVVSFELLDAADHPAGMRQSLGHALQLAQSMVRDAAGCPLRLRWLAPAGSLVGAALAGFVGVLAAEHVELRPSVIELDVAGSVDTDTLAAALAGTCSERRIVLSSQGWSRPTLRRLPASAPSSRWNARPSGAYLVTGAFGRLGPVIWRWLVERGASALVLLSRGGPSAELAVELQRLRERGVTVEVGRCDVSRRDALDSLLQERSGPAIVGVFHAASTLDDARVETLTPARFDQALAAKVAGAWNLDGALATSELDCFVSFGSASADFGPPGQAAYAAANAYLGAFAEQRRRRGQPSLDVAWGPWRRDADESGERRRPGLRTLAEDEAMRLLERALVDGKRARVLALAVDLDQFAGFVPGQRHPLVSAAQAGLDPQVRDVSVRGSVERSHLVGFLRQEVARLLDLTPARLHDDVGLLELGFDSFMAIDLRSSLHAQLKLNVSVELLLTAGSITDIAARTLESPAAIQVEPEPAAGTNADDELLMALAATPELLDAIEGLSSAELAAALTDEARGSP